MARNGPKIYKHSNVKGIILRVISVIIVAAIVLALTAFFGFRKFIAYTETGKLYLDIPWLYGYMDGPPAEDDLAPYLEPVVEEETKNVLSKAEETTEDDVSPDENTEPSEDGRPQYIDPNADSEDGEE